MKLEFLHRGGNPGRPLIRLFDYQTDEINLLRLTCLELAYGQRTEFALHEQPWCRPIAGCRFIWKASARDLGIQMPPTNDAFVLRYSKEAWLEVEGKLMPFTEQSSGYNWLTMEGEVDLLVSWDGLW